MANERAWPWSLALLAIVAICGAALPVLIMWSQLPEPLAVHWGLNGQPNGSMRKGTVLALDGGLLLLILVTTSAGAAHAYVRGRAMRLALLTFVCGLLATTSVAIVLANLDKAVWTEAEPLALGRLAAVVALPLVAAALAYYWAARTWANLKPPAPSHSVLALATGTKVSWTGSATNRWLLAMAAVLLLQALFMQRLLPGFGVAVAWLALFALLALALEGFSHIRVTVDDRGVAIGYGRLGLRTRFIPLAKIASASSLKLDPLEHGGWGYRGGLRLFGKAAIVVRAGDAMRLDLRDGKTLFVTVDDAATAASLLNALVAQDPRPPAARR